MPRTYGSKADGGSFSDEEVQSVWEKGKSIFGRDKDKYRKDRCGALIERHKHGDTKHPNGWEVDHDKPVAKGGSDFLSNLQPLQWENNRIKSDKYPQWHCAKIR